MGASTTVSIGAYAKAGEHVIIYKTAAVGPSEMPLRIEVKAGAPVMGVYQELAERVWKIPGWKPPWWQRLTRWCRSRVLSGGNV